MDSNKKREILDSIATLNIFSYGELGLEFYLAYDALLNGNNSIGHVVVSLTIAAFVTKHLSEAQRLRDELDKMLRQEKLDDNENDLKLK